MVTAYKPREMKLFSDTESQTDLPNKTLVVYGFDDWTSENELFKHFSQFGEILSCKILTLPMDESSSSFVRVCLVSFASNELADQVCVKLTNTNFKGQTLIAEQSSS